jgi:biotin synthase
MSVSQVKARFYEQIKGSSRLYGSSLRNVKDGPEFDQVLKWFVPSTNWIWKYVYPWMITENQAHRLQKLDYMPTNHNLDTSEEYYKEVISTRGFEDRLQTIEMFVKQMFVCSGGIIGMGESIRQSRNALAFLH